MDINQFKKELKVAGTSYTRYKNRVLKHGVCGTEKALLETIKYTEEKHSFMLISGYFTWSQTKEGHKYWNHVCECLRAINNQEDK
jgi:hypothetical protein